MADKPSTQDTIKNLLGDIADSSNKAFNDFLDPPNKSRKSDYPDWFGSGNPMAALAGTPLGALQAMAAFGGGGMNPWPHSPAPTRSPSWRAPPRTATPVR